MPNNRSSDNVLTAGEEEMTLGGRLYASRQNAGLSLNLAARLLGVTASTLKSWENEDGSSVKGRRGRLVERLKEEVSCAHEQQKQLNERLRKIDALIQKL